MREIRGSGRDSGIGSAHPADACCLLWIVLLAHAWILPMTQDIYSHSLEMLDRCHKGVRYWVYGDRTG